MSFERAARRRLTAAAVLLAALAGASAAGAASPGDRAAARQHVSQAEELLKKKGHLAEACQHLQEGERLDPQLPTLMELAECTEQLGKLVEAQEQWTLARDRAKHEEKPQSRARAEARLAALQKRVAHLTLQLAPTAPVGAQVLRDDEPLEPASLSGALPMDPGDHMIVVKVAGHDDAKYAVKLADGDNQTLAITAGPATGARTAAALPPSSSPPAPAPPSPAPAVLPSLAPNPAAEPAQQSAPVATGWWTGPRTAAVISGSAGIVGIGAGSTLYVVGKHDADKRASSVDARLSLGGMSIAAGGVLLVTALVLFASAPSDETHQHAKRTVTPTLLVARSAAVLGAAGEF